eukprot:28814-Eustigmatos_ZCMA.PRE.1
MPATFCPCVRLDLASMYLLTGGHGMVGFWLVNISSSCSLNIHTGNNKSRFEKRRVRCVATVCCAATEVRSVDMLKVSETASSCTFLTPYLPGEQLTDNDTLYLQPCFALGVMAAA